MAAKPYAYNQLVLGGTTAIGHDWSVGLSVTTTAAMSSAALLAWLEGIAADVKTSYNNSASNGWGNAAAPTTRLEYMRAYHYAAGGSSAALQAEFTWTSPQPGAGGTAAPSMVAMCVSKLTDVPGRSGRGRAYCPADGADFLAHQFTTAQVDAVGAGFRDLVDHINGSTIGGESAVAVVAAATQAVPITRVRVDSLVDTQRPREDFIAAHTFNDDV